MKASTAIASFSAGLLLCYAALSATESKVYLPVVNRPVAATRLPTVTPTPTRAPIVPTVSPVPPVIPTPISNRTCGPNSADWQGSNPNYPFCSGHDLSWANSTSNYIERRVGQTGWASAYWDQYGSAIRSVEIRLEGNNQLTQCRNGLNSKGGFRKAVDASGAITFPTNDIGEGLFKLELYFTLNDGRTVGRNEIFLCMK